MTEMKKENSTICSTRGVDWEGLVQSHYTDIYRYALQFFGNVSEAEDATQEAFLKAYKNKNSIQDISSIKSWLYKIVRNVCIDRSRWWKRWRKVIVPSDKEAEVNPENTSFLLKNQIASLPSRQKEVFILRHWHDFSTEETASFLGISQGAVKSHLKRAIDTLKEKLREDDFFNEKTTKT